MAYTILRGCLRVGTMGRKEELESLPLFPLERREQEEVVIVPIALNCGSSLQAGM